MLDELQRRNYSQSTVRAYIHAIEDFSKYFHRPPDRLGPDHIRQYQASRHKGSQPLCGYHGELLPQSFMSGDAKSPPRQFDYDITTDV
jgi:site-specific recombinase XerD